MNFQDYTNYNDNNSEDLSKRIRIMTNALRNRKNSNADYIYPNLDEVELFTNFCIEKENYLDAEMYAKIWIEYCPQSSEAFHKLGYIKLQLDELEEAMTYVDKALEFNPFDSDVMLTKVKIYEEYGHYGFCLDILENILTFDSTNEEAIFYKGIALSNMHLFNDAIEVFESIVENEDYRIDVLSELAIVYTELNNKTEAEKYYNLALDLAPFDSKIWYNKGLMHNNFGQLFKAIDALIFSISSDKKNYYAYKLLATIYANIGRFNESASIYESALEQFKNNSELLTHLGGVYGDIGMFDKAISSFTKAININENNFQAYLGRGICFDMIDEYENAIADYDSAIAIDPTNVELWYSKADSLYNMGKFKRALNSYKKVIEIDPLNEEAYYDYSNLLLEMEELEKAKDAFTDMITNFPHYAWGYYGLSKIYFLQAILDLALENLVKAIELDYELINDFKTTYKVLLQDYPEILEFIESKLNIND